MKSWLGAQGTKGSGLCRSPPCWCKREPGGPRHLSNAPKSNCGNNFSMDAVHHAQLLHLSLTQASALHKLHIALFATKRLWIPKIFMSESCFITTTRAVAWGVFPTTWNIRCSSADIYAKKHEGTKLKGIPRNSGQTYCTRHWKRPTHPLQYVSNITNEGRAYHSQA